MGLRKAQCLCAKDCRPEQNDGVMISESGSGDNGVLLGNKEVKPKE